MKIFALISGIAFLFHFPIYGPAQQKARLTLEAIAEAGLHEPTPSELRWAPDGRRLGYLLTEGNGERELWVLDMLTGERNRAVSSDQMREMAPSPDQALIGEKERARPRPSERERYSLVGYHR